MSLEDLAKIYAPIVQAIFSAFGLVTIILLWYQIKQTNKWNKLKTEQTFYSGYSRQLTKTLYRKLESLGIQTRLRTNPLSENEVDLIFNDKKGDAYYALTDFLNDLEVTCMSINAGKVDEEVAYETHSVRLNQAINVYGIAIKRIQEVYKGSNVFVDMFILKERWEKRKEQKEIKAFIQERRKQKFNRIIEKIIGSPKEGTPNKIK